MKLSNRARGLRFILGSMLLGLTLSASASATNPTTGPSARPNGCATVTSPKVPKQASGSSPRQTISPRSYAKIVVTDDNGRYLIPDLPKANYRVWVRGYGLVDSPKTETAPGKMLNLAAVAAPSAAAAAEYYPAIYWYSLLRIPAASEFPGTGDKGNGMPESLKSQEQWLDIVKTDGCYTCHQLGDKATRTIPKELGTFASSTDAWERRIQSGQAMAQMASAIGKLDTARALSLFANWTDRIAGGRTAICAAFPPGRRRAKHRHHDVGLGDAYVLSSRRNVHRQAQSRPSTPTALIYGAPEESSDFVPILDPARNAADQIRMPVRDPNTPSSKDNLRGPSPYWGDVPIWDSQTSIHNPMFDEKGRVWFTSRVGPPANPAFCKKGLGSAIRAALPARSVEPSPRDVRSEEPGLYADPHLLSDPSSAVRLRCE